MAEKGKIAFLGTCIFLLQTSACNELSVLPRQNRLNSAPKEQHLFLLGSNC